MFPMHFEDHAGVWGQAITLALQDLLQGSAQSSKNRIGVCYAMNVKPILATLLSLIVWAELLLSISSNMHAFYCEVKVKVF